MNINDLLKIAKQYGVEGINFGGCVSKQSLGFKGAMRRSAHAHCFPKYSFYGWICIKSSKIDKLLKTNGQPNELFWHEIGHIYRRSWSQKECDKWAWQQARR